MKTVFQEASHLTSQSSTRASSKTKQYTQTDKRMYMLTN